MPDNIKDKAASTASSASHTAGEAKGLAKETASTVAQKASDAASNLGQRAQEMASTVGHKAQDLASSAADRTEDAISSVGQGMSSLAGSIRQNAPGQGMLGSAAGAVADRLQSGEYLQQHDLGDMGSDIGRMIRQYPLPSLLVVFGLGYLLGSSLRR